ncbi:transposase [Mariniflexile sp.]|uniref:transposase n=1 Tax=Mariniflexile sp. TaxID=1979402 RepID=UPI0040479BDF
MEVFFIPPYSPELNPQEYVNQVLNTNVVGKKRPINKEQHYNQQYLFCTGISENNPQ